MSIPDTNNFSLQDVIDEVNPSSNSLLACFAAANDSGFDSAHEGSKDSLLNFRNYAHVGGPVEIIADSISFTVPANNVAAFGSIYIASKAEPKHSILMDGLSGLYTFPQIIQRLIEPTFEIYFLVGPSTGYKLTSLTGQVSSVNADFSNMYEWAFSFSSYFPNTPTDNNLWNNSTAAVTQSLNETSGSYYAIVNFRQKAAATPNPQILGVSFDAIIQPV